MPTFTRPRPILAVFQTDPRTDAELLDRFALHSDHAAFGTLVHRHGPLVYGVCRRALGPTADADDAFQATFLVLVRKARVVPWRANLGPWLYGVAVQITRKARFKRDRRFAVEKQVDAMPHPHTTPPDPTESDELSRAFDDELAALPDAMRRAVVLCELQGRSRQQAAKELRIGEGTLSSRLARARKILRDRLTKRGFALAVPASVAVSTKLTAATVGLTNGAGGVVPAAVSELAQEALKAMTISKLKLGAVLTAVAVGFTGFGLTSHGDDVKPPPKTDPQVKPAAATDKATGPVATIHGQDVSREEFGEYLIRKHGAKEIELFVNQKIIQAEGKKRGVSVTADEIEVEFQTNLKEINVTPTDFVKAVLPKYGKTEAEWREDVIRPRLLMEKIRQKEVRVKEPELKALFARKHGEKRAVQVVTWSREMSAKQVADLYEGVKKEPLLFDQFANRYNRPGQPEERTITIGKGEPVYTHEAVESAVHALKEADEVSDLIKTEHGWCAVKLIEIIPAKTDTKFEDEKEVLLAEVKREKLEQAMPKLFAELKEQAKPVYHIQPERKTFSMPVPMKK